MNPITFYRNWRVNAVDCRKMLAIDMAELQIMMEYGIEPVIHPDSCY